MKGRFLPSTTAASDITIPEQFPYKINNGILVFIGDEKDHDEETIYPVDSVLEFDPVKRETAFNVVDYWNGANFRATEIGPRGVEPQNR